MKLTFFGATHEVTGSCTQVEFEDKKILVDCGLYQGRGSAERNNQPFEVSPSLVDAVILTHAHIDHTGFVPVLVKKGFTGKIFCSHATFQLCKIMLADAAYLAEEEAKDRGGQPLYTQEDVIIALNYFEPVAFDTPIHLSKNVRFHLISSGHILGASFVVIDDGKNKLTFSGDLGRPNQFIMKAPPHIKETDYLVLESTYGNRLHDTQDSFAQFEKIINKTVARNGIIIIPSFAVGRAQMLLYAIYQLKKEGRIQDIPVFLDSPMAIDVTNLYCMFQGEHKLSPDQCKKIFGVAKYTQRVEESKQLDYLKHPAIIIAGSGMANGGRVVHHFKHYLKNEKNTVIFVGYQAEETSGRELVDGAKEIEIHGRNYEVNAHIEMIDSLSAHADYNEILDWLAGFERMPKKIFLTHGELESAMALKQKIEDRFKLTVIVPEYKQSFDLN